MLEARDLTIPAHPQFPNPAPSSPLLHPESRSANHPPQRIPPMGDMLEMTKQALWLTLLLSGPPVVAAAVVGLVVAFIQAATQLQEQTFAYAIKFTVIVVTLFVTASMIGGTLYTFADRIFLDFPGMIRH